MKKVVYIFVCSFLILGACSKEKEQDATDDEMMQDQELLLLKNVLKNGVLYDTYEYDDEQRLSKARVAIGINGIDYFLYSYIGDVTTGNGYDANDNLVITYTLTSINSESYRFDWDYDLSPPNRDFYTIVTYDSQECGIESALSYYTDDNSARTTKYFEYAGANCNDTEEYTDDYGTIATFVRTRDDKINASSGIHPQENFSYPAHNIRSETRYDENGEISELASYTSTFDYNSMGYPISEVRTYLGGMVDNYTYEYY